MEELQELQQAYTSLQLKLEHYKQKVAAQEEQIADLRIEITYLRKQLESNPQDAAMVNPQSQVFDAELVE